MLPPVAQERQCAGSVSCIGLPNSFCAETDRLYVTVYSSIIVVPGS